MSAATSMAPPSRAVMEPVPVRVTAVAEETHDTFTLTVAPRGLLYHRYSVDENRLITAARIVPPAARNFRRMEEGPCNYVPSLLELGRSRSPGGPSRRRATMIAASPTPRTF